MEIWIRSQDKEVLTLCRDLCVGGIYENEIIADAGCSIGTYKTKGRTLEVLDEIQKKINLNNLGHDFGSPMIDLKSPTYIYEMPKE